MDQSPRRPVTVALVNDYELVLRGLTAMLAPFADRVRVVELEVGGTPDRGADVALVDAFATPDGGVARAVETLRSGACRRVALYTWHATPAVADAAVRAGVHAVLSKQTIGSDLVDALEEIDRGQCIVHPFDPVPYDPPAGIGPLLPVELSPREAELLAWLTAGGTNAQIADAMCLAETTVKTYLQTLYRKLGVSNRTQAVALALQWQLTARTPHGAPLAGTAEVGPGPARPG
jgi:DNA-binding NarL/FixJ family response regulator